MNIQWTEVNEHDESKKTKKPSKIKRKLRDFGYWVDTHTDQILVLAPICIGGLTLIYRIVTPMVTKGVGGVTKNINLRKEQKMKELYCYDPSLGHYWRLNRKLTNVEWINIDKRRKTGERLSEILNDMKVLY